MVTWARENGLALYINGTEIARARGYMPQEGDHDKDTYTRLIVGRNAAGVPYGYTRMVVSSLAFFDAEVPAESAKDVFLYFSSNGKLMVSSLPLLLRLMMVARAVFLVKVRSNGNSRLRGTSAMCL